ncbi:MAG: FAD-dependent oxidoreductase [Gammaproteobacteria bacterium]|nr:FAD-dependent oxidoreductase [Gammaproteobacteria bacterium]
MNDTPQQTIVIIGAGHAGGQAAASLRQNGFDGDIIVLGDENYLPYQRPPLSKKYLSGAENLERLYLRSGDFYETKKISVRTGITVREIDRATHRLVTDGGGTISYDKLLLATGGRPRRLQIPGATLDGIFYLRTIDDVDRIRAALPTVRNLCVIGGGYIGLEVAAQCRAMDINVTVLEMEERLLHRVTTPELSQFYHQLHTSNGVRIELGTSATGFSGEQSVSSVMAGDRSFAADLVIVGIGILPNVELAQNAGLECNNGIVVNAHCQTSDHAIYAAGDCTNHPNPILQRRMRLESVPNAMEQAKVAAANLLNKNVIHDSVPWFWSDQYELKLQMVGFAADGDQHILRGSMANRQFAVFHLKDNRIVGVDAVGRPRDFMMGRKLYGMEVDPTILADETTDLKSLGK